jgi:hypothetical protein
MIFNGRIWADMKLDDIMSTDEASILNVRVARHEEDIEQTLSQLPGVTAVSQSRLNEFTIINDGRDATRMLVAETVVNKGWGLLSMAGARMNLETVFLNKMREADFAAQAMAEETLEEDEESAEMEEKDSFAFIQDESATEEEE